MTPPVTLWVRIAEAVLLGGGIRFDPWRGLPRAAADPGAADRAGPVMLVRTLVWRPRPHPDRESAPSSPRRRPRPRSGLPQAAVGPAARRPPDRGRGPRPPFLRRSPADAGEELITSCAWPTPWPKLDEAGQPGDLRASAWPVGSTWRSRSKARPALGDAGFPARSRLVAWRRHLCPSCTCAPVLKDAPAGIQTGFTPSSRIS
ncbi:hypothetical protein ACRAWD_24005 [Caulobacter segnis]